MGQPENTITVFFCGSGGNLSAMKTAKFAVPALFGAARGRHMGFDGVGGNGKGYNAYEMNPDGTLKIHEDKKVYSGPVKKWKGTMKGWVQGKNGRGTNCIATKAMDWIINEVTAFGKPIVNTINLCGHSRGSVTATMVAWMCQAMLLSDFPTMRVNLFLFDPVDGAANEFDKLIEYRGTPITNNYRVLPNIVEHFETVVSSNMGAEWGKGARWIKDATFGIAVPGRSTQPIGNYRIHCFPGGHNGATKYNTSNGGTKMGQIGMHLAYQFLTRHGSVFHSNMGLTSNEVLEAYAEFRIPDKAMQKYLKDGDWSHFDKSEIYKTSKNRKGFVATHNTNLEHEFFINKHHEDVFSHKFGAIAQYMRNNQEVPKAFVSGLRSGGVPNTVQALRLLEYI